MPDEAIRNDLQGDLDGENCREEVIEVVQDLRPKVSVFLRQKKAICNVWVFIPQIV